MNQKNNSYVNGVGQTLEVGSVVYLSYDRSSVATITRIDVDAIFLQWKDDHAEDESCYHGDDLRLYDPEGDKAKVARIQAKIDSAKNAFEHAFAYWQEANELADSTMNTDLNELKYHNLLDMKAFEQVVTSSGWISSGSRGLYC